MDVTTWEEWRAANDMPPPIACKEPGKCFDCGGDYSATTDRHHHSRVTNKGFVRAVCCACVDNVCLRVLPEDAETPKRKGRKPRAK